MNVKKIFDLFGETNVLQRKQHQEFYSQIVTFPHVGSTGKKGEKGYVGVTDIMASPQTYNGT